MKLIPHILLFFLTQALSLAHRHPFDPLTPSELTTVTNVVKSSHLGSSNFLTFHQVGLEEPDKPLMLSYLSNPSNTPPLSRRAFVIARIQKQTHELYVDITNKSIISDHIYEGTGYPVLGLDEQFTASLLPLNYTPFIESVKKRGVDIKDVVCSTFTVGWFGEAKQGKRTIKILCFLAGETVNFYVTPLEGITVVVDLDAMEIVEYKDRLAVPVPKSAGTDYRWSKQKPPFAPQAKPVTPVQPEGKGFEIEGHMVRYVALLHFSVFGS